jgi:hypothetical protein
VPRLPEDGGVSGPTREFSCVTEGHYRLTLMTLGLMLEVKRLRWERGELFGLLSVAADFSGALVVDGMMSVGTFNLTSPTARNSRAKELATRSRAPEIDFGSLLEELCQRSIKAEETGRPLVLLRNVQAPPVEDVDALSIAGFPILRNHASIVFGDGGTGKSTLALFFAGELERRGVSTLYLDWELDEYDHRRQLEKLFGSDMPDVKYRRCDRPLIIEAENIAEQVRECGVDFVICDSVAFACDGPPESAEVVQRYFRALRQLKVGSLNLAHVTKGENSDKRPFGSTFWFNGCRAAWYAERAEAASSDESIHVGLFHRKFNLGPTRSALGFDIEFRADRVAVTSSNVADNEQLATKLPLASRLFHALRRGPKTLAFLIEETGGTLETLERTIRRHSKTYIRQPGSDGVTRIALVENRRTA